MTRACAVQIVRLYGPGTNAEIAKAAHVSPTELYRAMYTAMRLGLLYRHEGLYMLASAGREWIRREKSLFAEAPNA